MKSAIQLLLHRLLGFKNYLFVFSLYKIYSLKNDRNEKDFFHFLKLIPPNTTVLDIGANIGIMTVHIAKSIPQVTVFSFEPMPNNINAFKRVIQFFKLKNVSLFEIALGNSEGEVEMVMPIVQSVKKQGLSHVVHESIPDLNEGERFKVPLKMLDKMEELIHPKTRISGIKIDVENFEYFVLDGARKLISQNNPVVYAELWDNENRAHCLTLFQELGYQTWVIVNNKMTEFVPTIHQTQNFIFVPR